MNKILLILIIAITSVSIAFGQTKIKYGYDNSGNRTSRTISLAKSAKVDSLSESQNQKYNETIENTQIIIYPNPTKGVLKIDIIGFDSSKSSSIKVYNIKGNLVTQLNPLSESNVIDLSSSAIGMYILKIIIGNEVSEWKILKE